MHRCISVEINDRQPFWPMMCQTSYRVTIDVAENDEWEAVGIALADVMKPNIWHPISEEHALWSILARDVREPKQDDEVRDAIRHMRWTERNAAKAGVSPDSLRGIVGVGIMVLDPIRADVMTIADPLRLANREKHRAAAEAGDRMRAGEDTAALSLT